MKKIMSLVSIITITVLVIDWGIAGLKLLDGNYDIITEAYIGLACLLILFLCAFCKIMNKRCPYCGKLRLTNGKYCSHCGMKVTE